MGAIMKSMFICFALLIVQALAAQQEFFGEDSGSNPVPVGSRPNSDAARAAFTAKFNGAPQIEDFESFAFNQDIRGQNLNFGVAGTATFTATGPALIKDVNRGFGRYPISGTQFLELVSGEDVEITFSNPNGVAAIGFYGIDIGDFSGSLQVTCVNGVVTNYPLNVGQNDGSVLFWGVTSDEVATNCKSIKFITQGGTDVFGFDDFTVGDISELVPPPGGDCCTAEELDSGACASKEMTCTGDNPRICTASHDGSKLEASVPPRD